MPRIPLLSEREVPWWVRLMYRYAKRQYGAVPESGMAAAHHPGLLFATGVHAAIVERAARKLDPALREKLREQFLDSDERLAKWWGRTPSWRR